MVTEATKRANGSPSYTYSNDSAIIMSSSWVVSFDTNDAEQNWLPFDHTRILNNSDFDLIFWKNFKEKHIVKSNSAYTLSEEKIDSFKITPKNSTDIIPSEQVSVSMKKLPITQNEVLREKESKKSSFLGGILNGFF